LTPALGGVIAVLTAFASTRFGFWKFSRWML
jgi:hypothetical protein